MNFFGKFVRSARLLKNVRVLCFTAVLTAAGIVLSAFDIPLFGNELQLSIGFIAVAVIGMLAGPAVGMAAGAVTDIVQALVFPSGAYFPGFTLSALVAGFIYGEVLFGRTDVDYFRALTARGFVNLICNSVLNTVWISMMGGKAMTALLPLRLAKNIALLPFEALIIFGVAKLVMKLPASMRKFE